MFNFTLLLMLFIGIQNSSKKEKIYTFNHQWEKA